MHPEHQLGVPTTETTAVVLASKEFRAALTMAYAHAIASHGGAGRCAAARRCFCRWDLHTYYHICSSNPYKSCQAIRKTLEVNTLGYRSCSTPASQTQSTHATDPATTHKRLPITRDSRNSTTVRYRVLDLAASFYETSPQNGSGGMHGIMYMLCIPWQRAPNGFGGCTFCRADRPWGGRRLLLAHDACPPLGRGIRLRLFRQEPFHVHLVSQHLRTIQSPKLDNVNVVSIPIKKPFWLRPSRMSSLWRSVPTDQFILSIASRRCAGQHITRRQFCPTPSRLAPVTQKASNWCCSHGAAGEIHI